MKRYATLLLGLLALFTGAARAKSAEILVTPTAAITRLEDGFSAAAFAGDDFFEEFLAGCGAASDEEVARFLSARLLDASDLTLGVRGFACSALSVPATGGGMRFGRNFDWYNCEAMVVLSRPEEGYASISTVNMDFLGSASGLLELLPPRARTLAALYAPLDGMNEKGLCAAVLMIADGRDIDQRSDKPDVTTTTAIRMLLNKAANVEEAVELLSQCDMHASMGLMVHFAIADAAGRSVAVEYVDGAMVVTDTPVTTNFYLAAGDLQGVGTAQSHIRYDSLMAARNQTPHMTAQQVLTAMKSVGKRNFNDGESTEWTVICDQKAGEARYYHRENYDTAYAFSLAGWEAGQ